MLERNDSLGRIKAVFFLAALFVFYVSTRPLGIHVSDSYAWTNTVDKSAYAYFFHPHHILYIPLAWRWTELLRIFFPGLDVWAALASLSALFGCLGVAAVYRILRSFSAGLLPACAGAALVAVSFGYWFFAGEAEVYVVSLSFVMWSLYFLSRSLTNPVSSRNAILAGAAAGLAALFHQTGIFLFVPAAYAFLGDRRTFSFRSMAAFTAVFALVVAPVYLCVAWAVLPQFSLAHFISWVFLFASKGYGGFSWGSTLRAPVGFARALVGGQMCLDSLRGIVPLSWSLITGCVLSVAAFVLTAFLAIKGLFGQKTLTAGARRVLVMLLVAFATWAAFGTYFDAVNFEWWTIPVAILLLAVALGALTLPRPAVKSVFCAILCLAGANFILDFQYRRSENADFLQGAARDIVAMTAVDDCIIAPSYLGVLIWHVDPVRKVFCPDEAVRISPPGSPSGLLLGAMASTEMSGRFIIAGADRDPQTAAFVAALLDPVPESEKVVIGRIRFLTGARGIVSSVSDVPVIAVSQQCLLRDAPHNTLALAPNRGGM